MSRIGKLPVHLPQGVTATVGADNVVLVKGPLREYNHGKPSHGPAPSPFPARTLPCTHSQYGDWSVHRFHYQAGTDRCGLPR